MRHELRKRGQESGHLGRKNTMTSRMLHRGLAAAFASLVLACGADDNIESSREAVPGAARTMAVTARTEALDCVSSGACFVPD
jgi:hypothetical protein